MKLWVVLLNDPLSRNYMSLCGVFSTKEMAYDYCERGAPGDPDFYSVEDVTLDIWGHQEPKHEPFTLGGMVKPLYPQFFGDSKK